MAKQTSSILTQSIPNLLGGVSQQAPALRSNNQCEVMTNAFPSVVEGLMKRAPTEKVAELRKLSDNSLLTVASETTGKTHLLIRDINEKYVCFIQPSEISVYDLNGVRKTVFYDTGALAYLAAASRDTIKALTIADVTFVANTATTAAMDAALTPAIGYTLIAFVYVKQNNYSRNISVTLTNTGAGTTTYTFNTPHNTGDNGTHTAAAALAALINGTQSYTAVAVDSVLKLTRSALPFTVIVNDDFGGQGAVVIRDTVQRFEDLPATCAPNHVVKVIGAPESNLDDYYVKFEAQAATMSKGVWRETVAPNIKYKFNYATMPHILIRQSDGTFMFKKADGTTPAANAPVGANYTSFKWAERLCGDDLTNSEPSFIGGTVANMVLFKNRFGLLSAENVILSEVSEFFNFWRTTVLDVPDTDSIDVSSSNSKISKIKSGLVFNTELVLFTDSSQMVLRGGEILSPRTVSLLPVGDYTNHSDLQPVSSGLSVFFGFNRGAGFAGFRELIPQPNIDGSYIINTLSDVAPAYVPNIPSHITSTSQEDVMAVVSAGDLYLYKYLRTQEALVQNAWFKYNFPDTRTSGSAKVIWAEFVDSELYILTLRNNANNPVLEKIRLGVDLTDAATVPGSTWLTHLDARALYASATGTYSSVTGLTTWLLQKPFSYSATLTQIYTTTGVRLLVSGGTSYNSGTDAAGTVTAVGDYSTTAVWIGFAYEMVYEFSQLWLPAAAGRGTSALLTGRYQLKYMSILYEDTGFFKVQTIVGEDAVPFEYIFSGTLTGSSSLNVLTLSRGSFRVPVYGKNTQTRILIKNASALPCKLLSAEVEAEYSARATRFA